jgi:hypothetical protein
MRESEWVSQKIEPIQRRLSALDEDLQVLEEKRLPYAHEVYGYEEDGTTKTNTNRYETDILIAEGAATENWKPRVVVEVKLRAINTHNAIAYSQKARTHKHVHPYLRYGVLLADLNYQSLPRKLLRHGTGFDFMIGWEESEPSDEEFDRLIEILLDEVKSSRKFEEVLRSRSSRSMVIRKPLILE